MTESISPEFIPRPAKGLVQFELDGDLVLWGAGRIHRLDPVGSVVWAVMDGETTISDLARILTDLFRAEATAIERDLRILFRRLIQEGLLEVEADGMSTDFPRSTSGTAPFVGPGPLPKPAVLADFRWAHYSRRFRAISHDFCIRSTDVAIGRYIDKVLGALSAPGSARHVYSIVADDEPGGGRRYAIYLDDLGLVTVDDASSAVNHVLWHLNSEVIRSSQDHLLIHAAGAVSGDSAVVLPGPINAGKTTLVGGLVLDGFGLLTDELVALHLGTGRIDPYPRPLNVNASARSALLEMGLPKGRLDETLGQWHIEPLSIRPNALASPAMPRFVVTPRYEPGGETRLEFLSRWDALRILHGQCMNGEVQAAAGFTALVSLVSGSVCARLVSGALAPAVRLVRQLVESHV